MSQRRAEYIDVQERGLEFSEGDKVVPFGANGTETGRVTAVFPGIGYVDVEFAGGNERVPVEDLVRIDSEGVPQPPHTNSAPVTDMVRTALEAVKEAATQPYLCKVAVLESLQASPEKVANLGLRIATEFWAVQDPGSMLLLLNQFKGFGSKNASVSCVQRWSQGKKPFLANPWERNGQTWARTLDSQLLRNLKVANIRFEKGKYLWFIGARTASGDAQALVDAQTQVDTTLAGLGYALR